MLEDIEKNLEEHKEVVDLKEKQLSDAKKILVSAKNSYDKTVAKNKELKAYIQNIKQHFQEYQEQQQACFLENQKNYYEKREPKRNKKVVYEEEPDSGPELKEEEYCADEIEEPKIKKKQRKGQEKEKIIFSTI